MTLGEKLQTLRRSRGLSQEQLAEILEVSRQAVSKWENGDSAPDLDRLRAICTYFGVTTDYLIWDEPEDAPRGAEKARSRETQRKPLRETVREHSEWAGYAVAILGAAMLLRALPGMILQMLLLAAILRRARQRMGRRCWGFCRCICRTSRFTRSPLPEGCCWPVG